MYMQSPGGTSFDTDRAGDSNGGAKVAVSDSGQEAGGGIRLVPPLPPPRTASRAASGVTTALEEWAVFSAAVPSGAGPAAASKAANKEGMRVSGGGQQLQTSRSEEQSADEWGDFQDTSETTSTA